jgi:signal peptidase II
MKKKKIIIFILIILLVFFDYLTKYIVLNRFSVNESIIIIKNFLKFTYIKNTGAAFGLLSGNIIVLILITVVLLFYLLKEFKNSKNKLNITAYTLIISGAIGNLIDRIFRKYVVDFISFTLFGHDMAIFNVADTYITIGVILLLYNILREDLHERSNSKRRR